MNIVKKEDSKESLLKDGKLKATSPFQRRRMEAEAQASAREASASTMPHRIALMLDCSSSMSCRAIKEQTRIDLLKEAVMNFSQRCNYLDTSVAIATFPSNEPLPLTCDSSLVATKTLTLVASGGTPMHQCVKSVIEDIPLTRGVIVSDGEAGDWRGGEMIKSDPDKILDRYKELRIAIDCVHIGESSRGEDLLRRIAKITGGLYIKFTDVSAFSKAFGYLAPAYRALLVSGDAKAIGAKEIE